MTPQEVREAVEAGALVLDLRPPRPFAAGHVPGAVTMQFNRADLADRAELVLPKELRLVVHAEPAPIATTAVEILRGAGYEVLGHLEGGLAAWRDGGEPVAELPLLDVDELHDHAGEYLVLDVREGFEYRHGHVAGARLLPSGEAWDRVDEVPVDRPVAVICGDQTRSAAVASMLLRAGRDARLVMGGMVDWLERGFPTEKQAVAT
ncbi:MAG TPA: rhodanese-like domain-containing protein [Gaiellaceae bacterium]|jgi:hydroxyacylglutathione hydrolase|nr:rhodanese-like domain-containing protein [Gaiellaceae bacterium]